MNVSPGVNWTLKGTMPMTVMELIALRGSITTFGTLDVSVSDDLLVSARKGDVALLGASAVRAADHTVIEARKRDVTRLEPKTATPAPGKK